MRQYVATHPDLISSSSSTPLDKILKAIESHDRRLNNLEERVKQLEINGEKEERAIEELANAHLMSLRTPKEVGRDPTPTKEEP
jgi:hypothetical protein